MTDEMGQIDERDDRPEVEEHPELAAIAGSLEPEAAPAVEPAPEPASAVEAVSEPAPEPEPVAAVAPVVESAAGTELAVESGEALRSPDAVSWWPFLVYLAVWVIFAGVVIWRFYDLPQGQAVYESPLYPLSVFGGVALTIAGPLLSFATWVAAWGAPGSSKWGQFVSALVKGSAATAGGVVLWWLALVIVDQIRLGRVF